MKHTQKRILSIFAAAAFSLCSLPQSTPLLLRPTITASAENTTDQGLQYEAADGEICITGYTNSLPAEIEIPAEIGGIPVTSKGKWKCPANAGHFSVMEDRCCQSY